MRLSRLSAEWCGARERERENHLPLAAARLRWCASQEKRPNRMRLGGFPHFPLSSASLPPLPTARTEPARARRPLGAQFFESIALAGVEFTLQSAAAVPLQPGRRIAVSDEVLHLSINANQSEQLKAPTYSINVAAGSSGAESVGSLSVFRGINNLIKSNDR